MWASCSSVSKSLIGAQAADDEAGAAGPAEVDRQAVEALDLDRGRRDRRHAVSGGADRPRSASRRGSSGALRGLSRTADDDAVEHAAARRDDVEMAVGDRVERARVDRDRLHRSSSRAGRTSAPSRRSGAPARMLAARSAPAAARARSAWRRRGRRGQQRGCRAAVERRDEQVGVGVRRVDDRRCRRRRPRVPRRAQPARARPRGRRGARARRDAVRARFARDHRDGRPVALDEVGRAPRRATAPRCPPRRCRRTGRGTRRPGRSGSRIANSVCLTRSRQRPRRPRPGRRGGCPRADPGDDPAGVSHRRARHHRAGVAGRRPRRRRSQPSRARALRAGSGGSQLGRRASSSASACARARTASSRCSGRCSDATRSRGRPLWARPRTSPSRRSSKSFSASSKPSCVSTTASSRACAPVSSVVVARRGRRTTRRRRGRRGRGAGGAGRARTGRRPR